MTRFFNNGQRARRNPVDREFEHGSVQTKDCELVFVVSQD
jgi:hypothetical protein